MLRNYEVEYLSVIEDADKEDDAEFCFDHLVIKGELVVLVCEKDQNFKIFSGDDLSLVSNLYLSDKYPIQQNSQVKFHDITVIEHDPNAYIIFTRIEVDADDQGQYGSIISFEVFTTVDPVVFVKTFDVEHGHDFKLWAQAKGMYLSMRF